MKFEEEQEKESEGERERFGESNNLWQIDPTLDSTNSIGSNLPTPTPLKLSSGTTPTKLMDQKRLYSC